MEYYEENWEKPETAHALEVLTSQRVSLGTMGKFWSGARADEDMPEWSAPTERDIFLEKYTESSESRWNFYFFFFPLLPPLSLKSLTLKAFLRTIQKQSGQHCQLEARILLIAIPWVLTEKIATSEEGSKVSGTNNLAAFASLFDLPYSSTHQ